MGKLEKISSARTRRTKINNAILLALGISIVGMLNSQALVRAVLKELRKPKDKRRAAESAIYAARRRLAHKGLIFYQDGFWRITEEGKKFLSAFDYASAIPKPKRWDKKWRILIFDIREERKRLREKIRRTLVALGFRRLQDSVWVYPYDCEDLIALLKTDFKVGKDLLYIIADQIENDGWLCREFGLPTDR